MDLMRFAECMAASAIMAEKVKSEMIEDACKTLQKSAQDAIGTYEFGWEPLAADTIARKGADTPLEETSALKGSIEWNSGVNEGEVGTNDPKAAFHEFGTSHNPARPFLGGAIEHTHDEIEKILGTEVFKIFVG